MSAMLHESCKWTCINYAGEWRTLTTVTSSLIIQTSPVWTCTAQKRLAATDLACRYLVVARQGFAVFSNRIASTGTLAATFATSFVSEEDLRCNAGLRLIN